jgi:hypothetical protein
MVAPEPSAVTRESAAHASASAPERGGGHFSTCPAVEWSSPVPFPESLKERMDSTLASQFSGTVAIIADAHRDDGNDAAWDWACDRLSNIGPDRIIILGDFITCGGLSTHPRFTPDVDRFARSLERATVALDDLRSIANVSDYLEGNHEIWLKEYVVNHPELEGIIDLPKQLELDRRGIRWTPNDRPLVEPWAVMHHGNATQNSNTALRFFGEVYGPRFAYGLPVLSGHFHHLSSLTTRNGVLSQSCGYLGADHPSYLKANIPAWSCGFRVLTIEADKMVASTEVRKP